jgi:23S rRNA 5-hydroxycytidine C2501 synthase
LKIMRTRKTLELLSPARDRECGIAAIAHGADAIYVGAPKFGARAAAGNSLKDIASLIDFAHKYWARVYITLNTMLYDHELAEAESLIRQLYEAGADALIFQDMGLLELGLPPIPLFASTQTHNYDVEKILFLERVGVQRVILARELSLKQIAEIRSATRLDLEFFVHGSLCVSFSGQCYLSQAVTGRSANRGECAQMCRLPYTLTDERGNILARNQHLLSLKDLNLSEYLPQLVDAGITSFKIEGRLKDAAYVKNVTSFYRSRLDAILEQRPGFRAASSGKTLFTFAPDPSRSFNRGFTDYFLKRRTRDAASTRTPKSLGAALGKVTSVRPDSFVINSSRLLHNGDGICFFDTNDELRGVNINRVEGELVYPNSMDGIEPGAMIYRNHDHNFTKLLQGKSATRKIDVEMALEELVDGLALRATDEDGVRAVASITHCNEVATKTEAALQTMQTQLARTGDTDFTLRHFVYIPATVYFVPASVLNTLRRECLSALAAERTNRYPRQEHTIVPNDFPFPVATLDRYANVTNEKARTFYRRHGVSQFEDAVEQQESFAGTRLMTNKYCLKYQFDLCRGEQSNAEELYLSDGKRRYKLEFDCDRCVMRVIAP